LRAEARLSSGPDEAPLPSEALPAKAGESQLAFEAWNGMAAEIGLPVARLFTDKRRSAMKLRLRELGGLARWLDLLKTVRETPFLRGESDIGFQCDIDFLLAPRTFNRVLDGFYARLRSKPGKFDDIFALDERLRDVELPE